MIDGLDVRFVTQDSLRRAIGVVPQDTVLFNDQAAYNIAYGSPGADERLIIDAAQAARVHSAIEQLPDGYATMVGERGLKLSGGEKQRTAIARVLLKSPRILVLDEATSSLDSRTKYQMQERLDELSKHRSTLIIAHRLSTIANADEILFLVDGRILERGRHCELLAPGGIYAAMWHRQEHHASRRQAV